MKKKFRKILVAIALASSFTTLSATNPVEDSQGYIMEAGGQPIVGVWVEVHGGRSGWARFNPAIRGQRYSVSWEYDTQGKPFELHIGVGGTPQKWKYIYILEFLKETLMEGK